METAFSPTRRTQTLEISLMELKNDGAFGRFDVNEIAKSFPQTADTLLLDTYLTNEEAASARIFRVYKETPPHYHATCDEYLYVPVRPGRLLDGQPGKCGRIRAWELAVLQAWNCSRPARHRRVARRVSLGRHAAARSQGHHIREPRRRDTGKVHSTTAVINIRDRPRSPTCWCFFRARSAVG